jgi:hypothetical protein
MFLTEYTDIDRYEKLIVNTHYSRPWLFNNFRDQISLTEFKIQHKWAEKIDLINKSVNILNSGFGFFSVPLAYEKGAKKISLYDLDPTTRDISGWINGIYKPEFNHHIVNTTFDYDMMDQSADVWINTSCEHSYPMKDILPSGALCVMSGNALTKRGHINLINSIEELKEQCELSLVIDEDEIVFQYEDELGKRDYTQYMIIGIK